jgi:hypothetical protein
MVEFVAIFLFRSRCPRATPVQSTVTPLLVLFSTSYALNIYSSRWTRDKALFLLALIGGPRSPLAYGMVPRAALAKWRTILDSIANIFSKSVS